MAQAFRTCVTKFFRSSSLPIADPPPVGGHTGATSEPTTKPLAAILSASVFRSSSARVDADVRIEEKEIDAVELLSVDAGGGRALEHRVEVDRRLGVGTALADQPGPHRIVNRGVLVLPAHGVVDLLLFLAQRFVVGIARPEVLENHERV